MANSNKKSRLQDAGKKERIQYLDVLRVCTIFLVIIGNTYYDPIMINFDLLNAGTASAAVWYTVNFLCIPIMSTMCLFMMLSAALITRSDKAFRAKYVALRALKYYLILLLSNFGYYFFGNLVNQSTYPKSALFWSNINNPISPHLNFILIIIGFTILAPILKTLLDHASEKLIFYMLGIWYFFVVATQLLEFFPRFTLHAYQNLHFYSGLLGCFILGYYLHRTKRKFPTKIVLPVLLVTMALFSGTTLYVHLYSSKDWSILFSYVGPFTAVCAACFYILIKNRIQRKPLAPKGAKLMQHLSKVSMYMFLVHMAVINLFDLKIFTQTDSLILRLLAPVFVLVISYAVSELFYFIVQGGKKLFLPDKRTS